MDISVDEIIGSIGEHSLRSTKAYRELFVCYCILDSAEFDRRAEYIKYFVKDSLRSYQWYRDNMPGMAERGRAELIRWAVRAMVVQDLTKDAYETSGSI